MQPSLADSITQACEDLTQGLVYLDAAREAGDQIELRFQYDQAMQDLLRIGMLHWRARSGSPAEQFRELVGLARTAVHDLEPLSPLWREVAFWSVPYAAILCSTQLGTDAEPLGLRDGVHQPLISTESFRGGGLVQVFDRYIACALETAILPPAWDVLVSAVKAKRGMSLPIQTYENYRAVIAAALGGDHAAAERGFAVGSDLYAKRAKLPNFGRVADGAGPSNAYVVDYRLGAIRRWSERRLGAPILPIDDLHRPWW
jgi:hypothetical protein